jgi:Tc toxin complex TcA C-terminal TcB-binding domain/Concanavalin A-like lectin/glucanases superfamily
MDSLGGDLAGPPTAVSWGPSRIDVFAVSPVLNTVSWWFWEGGVWSPPIPLAAPQGGLNPEGLAAVSLGPNSLDVFAAGPGNTPWWWHWTGSKWTSPVQLPAGGARPVRAGLAATSCGPGLLDVFGASGNGTLWWWHWDGSQWLSAQPISDTATASDERITAISAGPNQLDVFAPGSGNQLWNWFGGPYQAWSESPLGGNIPAEGAAVASWGPGRIDVFAASRGSGSNPLQWWSGSGSTFAGPTPPGGGDLLAGTPGAVAPAVNRVYVFAISGAKDLVGWRMDDKEKWTGPQIFGTGLIAGDLSAVSIGLDDVHVFARGNDNRGNSNILQHWLIADGPPTITITPAGPVQAGRVTVSGVVSGGAAMSGSSVTRHAITAVTVSFNSSAWPGPPVQLTASVANEFLWSATADDLGQGLGSGYYPVVASVTNDVGEVRDATATLHVDAVPVTLSLPSTVTSSTVACTLQVTADSPSGVTAVQWATDPKGSWTDVVLDTPGAIQCTGTVTVSLPPSVNGTPGADGYTITVYLRGTNASTLPPGSLTPTVYPVGITWLDRTPPTAIWQDPQDGAALELLGTSTEARLTILATVSDADNGVVSSGVQYVRCTIDGGVAGQNPGGTNPVVLKRLSGADSWSAGVTLVALPGMPLEGPHTLQLDCADNARYAAPQQTRTVVVRRSGIQGATAQDYLADLVDYVRNRLLTRSGSSVAVTASQLEGALCQPFRRLAGAGATRVGDAVASRPINAVRGVVEVLRAYLAPQAPAPVAHWPLDEGSGTSFRDDTGAGSDGILVGASQVSWGPGPAGGQAPVFDGTSTYVQVGTSAQGPPQLAITSAAVTVTAWINPGGPGGTDGSAIAGWDGAYLMAYFDDHTIGWALSSLAPGWGWVRTGVVAPQGQWSHVAVSYDGSFVRTYLNGVFVHWLAGAGPIVANPTVPFCVGDRPDVAGSLFNGSIADVGVYDRGLTDYDINLLLGRVSTADEVWLDDALPTGVQSYGDEPWTWTAQNPTPYSGTLCHFSPAKQGEHQHYFAGGQPDPSHPAGGWQVNRGDRLYSYVFLDPNDSPGQVMLQWEDGSGLWWRAYWGENSLGWTGSMTRMGDLPPTGKWVRLEVPAAAVGLEGHTVTGLAFTLYGGQAWWDMSGRTTSDYAAILAGCDYLSVAYEAILVGLATSSEELRTARTAQATPGQPDPRAALAARLGMVLRPIRPDQLDWLLLSSTAADPASLLSEANLERLFGLQRTDTDPLSPSAATPLVQIWQEDALRGGWAAEDYGTVDPADFSPPIVDPDIVVAADISNPTDPRGLQALAFRQDRARWLESQTAALNLKRPSSGQGLPALLTATLGTDLTSPATTSLASQSAQGYDISPKLATVPIAVEAFDRLVTLSGLPDALRDDEWDDASAIIVQVLKTRQFAGVSGWRQQESATPSGLLLDPLIFRASSLAPDQLPRWRGSWSARVRWQNRLEGRGQQLADVAAGLAAAVAASERAALPLLRDALLAVAAPSPPDPPSWPSAADELSRRLCTDLQVGPQLTTTHAEQAADALQVLLANIDSTGGLASSLDTPWVIDPAAVSAAQTSTPWFDRFQGELSWMGSYNTWLSAMTVFLYPENYLLPSIRTTNSPVFQNFIAAVTAASPPTSSTAARTAAAAYWDDDGWRAAPNMARPPALPPGNLPGHGTGVATLPGPSRLTATASASGGSLPAGTYEYEVTAVTPTGPTTPTMPVSATVTGGGGSVTLTWASVPHAVSYTVYGRVAGSLGRLAPEVAPRTWTDSGSAPVIAVSPYPYTERLSSEQLDQLQALVPAPPDAASYREVYFDLPLQLALSLRDAGQWGAGLDWLRIIYDRDRPPANRWNFPVSTLEGVAGSSTQPENIARDENSWLAGGQLDPHVLASTRGFAYQRYTLMTIAGVLCDWADAQFALDTDASRAQATNLYIQALDVLQTAQNTYLYTSVLFIPLNPELLALIGRATNPLAQLRAGLNIAGMARPLSTGNGGAPAAPPATNFRYATLIARAQQLVTSAAQIEATYLASLQQKDNENYQQLLAGQDLSVASAQVTIAYDQATIASEQVQVAQLQVQRAQTQVDTYAAWIAAGPNSYEQDQLAQLGQQSQWQNYAAIAQATAAVAQATAAVCGLDKDVNAIASLGWSVVANLAAGAANAAAAGFSDAAQQAAIAGQTDALHASWERRQEEWGLQQQLAAADVAIGKQQGQIAQGQAYVAGEQAAVASLNQRNAEAKLQFLQTKFTSAQLYTWMAGVLSGVYRYFLQQAAGVARLAEQQLAFERQLPVPGYIRSDYWTQSTGGSGSPVGAGGIPSTGTGGLTGSARLLEDITQLDQYALETQRRKLQLTQTFSLASLAPVDLQRFRQTGVLPFVIPATSYGAPGTYLAMIRAVRISIAALIPPAQGVRGTLTSAGSSHIVVQNNDMFQTVTLARPPETIAVTSPLNAGGVFQLDLTPELLLPFEGCGLDLPLELQLPQAINAFDYRTIADVQVSVDYTAQYSPAYATQVIRQLPAQASNSILLSLRDFPDAWYALLAQAQELAAGGPTGGGGGPPVLLATWPFGADDLPANLSSPSVEQLTLMVVRSGSVPAQFSIDHLDQVGVPPPANPTSTVTIGDIVSTRNGSGTAWRQFTHRQLTPIGTWELGLVGSSETINAVAGGDLQDIALVIGYSATLPAWPS